MCQDAGCIGLTNAFRASAGVRAMQRDQDRLEEEDCANRQHRDKRKGEAGQRDRVGSSAVHTPFQGGTYNMKMPSPVTTTAAGMSQRTPPS